MTATLELIPGREAPMELEAEIDAACGRIAPAWPLDRLIAVNPWWGYVGRPMDEAAAELAALAGSRLLMPRDWYARQWEAGRFTERHLQAALSLSGSPRTAREVLAGLELEPPAPPVRHLIADLADEGRDLSHEMTWGEFVTRHVSQTCAACFDEGQARWMPVRSAGLYPLWRELAARDGSPRLMMGLRGFRAAAGALPEDPRALIALAVEELGVPASAREAYFTALLMTVQGWASACAFRRWEARLAGGDDDQLVHLLATRLAWELVLYRAAAANGMKTRWARVRREWSDGDPAVGESERDDWAVQRALELAYQERLAGALSRQPMPAVVTPAVQAVFCIDVRSEVFRRALEATGPAIQTLGFAGFFGLPIAYAPPVGPARAQLPGLLAPGLLVRDAGAGAGSVAEQSHEALSRKAAWKDLAAAAGSMFSFVETAGMGAAGALLRDALS